MAYVIDTTPHDVKARRKPMIEPVRCDVTVPADVGEAFRLFTDEMAAWWPLETHSMASDRDDGTAVRDLVFEGREGGRLYEVADDGTEGTWGRVVTWEPPRRLVLAWKPNLRAEPETEVEITFTPVDGGTRVDLEHRGWERLGPRGPVAAEGYRRGWPYILGERLAAVASERWQRASEEGASTTSDEAR
jgi:uncharacterized protein YndB with AHSA1/START domain